MAGLNATWSYETWIEHSKVITAECIYLHCAGRPVAQKPRVAGADGTGFGLGQLRGAGTSLLMSLLKNAARASHNTCNSEETSVNALHENMANGRGRAKIQQACMSACSSSSGQCCGFMHYSHVVIFINCTIQD